MQRLAVPLSALVLLAATALAFTGEWPWQRLPAARPIIVTTPYHDSADTLRRGETLSLLLARNNLAGREIGDLFADLGMEARRVREGLVFHFRRLAGEDEPTSVTVRTGPEERLRLIRASGGWTGERVPVEWATEALRVSGRIDHSLYGALDQAVDDALLPGGERVRLAWDLADVFAWSVDFTRDIQRGDEFSVVLERLVSEEGELRFGQVLASELTVNGRTLTAYRFRDETGRPAYFDHDGNSLRRAFLMAPLEFRRISSGLGNRRHPILGTMRVHHGIDYAAPAGTPVRAAGDGTVTRAGRAGGFGNLVEIRHRNGITTRYAHLSGFAAGIRAGTRVTQGRVIGFVGSTGLSTAPHLHYEFRVNGTPRDPRRVDLGNGEPIAPSLRAEFERERDRLGTMLRRPAARPPGAIVD
jgi:murein DD-endopeptidase MepM/ murein hydrolase activator NlpD